MAQRRDEAEPDAVTARQDFETGAAAPALVGLFAITITLITTFRYWRQGLVSFGVPDLLSWILGIPAATIIALAFLGCSVALGRAHRVADTGGEMVFLMAVEFLVMVGLAYLYTWVCERGGGIDVVFP
ncbi:MAG: hypothetical protein GEV03_18495 [Streptosporangiales bacterium]|nr:hypothetical protein [Streptosporangiales bacterium]